LELEKERLLSENTALRRRVDDLEAENATIRQGLQHSAVVNDVTGLALHQTLLEKQELALENSVLEMKHNWGELRTENETLKRTVADLQAENKTFWINASAGGSRFPHADNGICMH
jgi:cell division protein FtsB